jgi:hypothetical protein
MTDFDFNFNDGDIQIAMNHPQEIVIIDAGKEIWRGTLVEYAELLETIRTLRRIVGRPL